MSAGRVSAIGRRKTRDRVRIIMLGTALALAYDSYAACCPQRGMVPLCMEIASDRKS